MTSNHLWGKLAVGLLTACLVGEVQATVATPTISPPSGNSATRFGVVVSCATSGATIRYTLNGVDPTVHDPIITSGGIVAVQKTQELRVKAWVGTDVSATATGNFEVFGEVAAGAQHALALKSFGSAYAWGYQQLGDLGNNQTSGYATSPGIFYQAYPSTPFTNAASVAAGDSQSIILERPSPDGNGRVWAVGGGTFGQLGNNDNLNSKDPVRVLKPVPPATTPGSTDYLANCVAVAAGLNFSGALGSDGKVYTWGSQQYGRLGDSFVTNTKRLYAGPVLTGPNVELANIVDIEFGDTQALAIDSSGDVWSWGYNSNYQLGHDANTNQGYAKTMAFPDGLATGATSISTSDAHSAVVRWVTGQSTLQGSVWSIGNSQYGRVGNGSAPATATNVTALTRVKTGTGTTPADYLSGIVQVSCGSVHTLALDTTGHVWAWGYDAKGALGDNNTANSGIAIKVLKPAAGGPGSATGDSFLTNVVWISAGGTGLNSFSVAITKDGTVYTWGANDSGQLANGTSGALTNSKLPVAVGSLNLHPIFPASTISHNVTTLLQPGAATLTAVPTDADGTIQKVEFFVEGALVATKTASPWTYNLTSLVGGTYQYTVRVTDNGGNMTWATPSSFFIREDTDGDGLWDTWENTWFGSLAQNGSGDPDHDGVTTADEFALGTNPNTPPGSLDTDNDGLPDDWETAKFGGLGGTNTGALDADGDGLTNKWEFDHGTNPNTPAGQKDADGDGLPDDWERYYFAGSTTPTATGDFDGDGLTNSWEYAHLTNPASTVADSDGDGLADDWEVYYFGSLTAQTKTSDADSDGLTNEWEFLHGTVPTTVNGSSDGDSLPDVWEVFYFGSAATYGNNDDPDGDHLTNLQEFQDHSNPNDTSVSSTFDADHDGLPDDWERHYFSNTTSQTGATDYDGDGLSNLWEFNHRTNPVTAPANRDADADGLPDDWEVYYFGAINTQTGASHSDSDKITNAGEYLKDTNPTTAVDSDGDGLPDDWEIYYFGTLAESGTDDHDGDHVSNYNEFVKGSNPASAVDSDADGMADDWEIFWFTNLSQTGTADYDGDGLSNQWESVHGTDPKTASGQADTDGDGLPDDWERLYFGNLDQGPDDDADFDQVTTGEEYLQDTNPNRSPDGEDLDGDGLPDDWELFHFGNVAQTGAGDYDHDGVTNLQEFLLGTDPCVNSDTDADGIPDDLERLYFGHLGESSLSGRDSDGDGITDAAEITAGTNPYDADSDHDGILDGVDSAPTVPATVSFGSATTLMIWSPIQ